MSNKVAAVRSAAPVLPLRHVCCRWTRLVGLHFGAIRWTSTWLPRWGLRAPIYRTWPAQPVHLMHAFSILLSEAACHRVWRDGPSCTSRSGAGRRAGALRFVRSFAFDQVQSEGSKPQCDLGSERYLAIWPGGARNRRLCLNRPVVAACYAMLQRRISTARKKFMQATFTAWMIAYPHN